MENLPTALNLNDPKVIETIKRTVAQGVDDIELAMFLELCKASGLNPFKKEAWCIKAGNRAQIMVGLNGYLKIANSHPQFDGMEIMLDSNEKGELVSATCKVHRKDRKYPSTGIAFMREYRKETPIWKQMPSVMLGKVAKCIAIREAFPLETAGTYAEEEMPETFAARNSLDAQILQDKAEARAYARRKAEKQEPPKEMIDQIFDGYDLKPTLAVTEDPYLYDIEHMEDSQKKKAIEALRHKYKAKQDKATGIWYSPVKIDGPLGKYLMTTGDEGDLGFGPETITK